jgi:hypothetical protein
MTSTNHSDGARSPAAEPSQLLETYALGRTRMSQAQREAILDVFHPSLPFLPCVRFFASFCLRVVRQNRFNLAA